MPPATVENAETNAHTSVLLVGDGLSSVASTLESALDCARVVTETARESALERIASDSTIGCVVAEHHVEAFDGVSFLRTVRAQFPELPFVLYVTKGDDAVAAGLDAGATDVVDGYDQSAEALLTRRVTNALRSRECERRLSRRDADGSVARSVADLGALAGTADLEAALETAVRVVGTALALPAVAVFADERADGGFDATFSEGPSRPVQELLRGASFVTDARATGDPTFVTDARAGDGFAGQTDSNGSVSGFAVPISVNGVEAMLAGYDPSGRPFDDAERAFVTAVAAALAFAVAGELDRRDADRVRERTSDGILELDDDLRVTAATDRAAEILNRDRDEVLDARVFETFSTVDGSTLDGTLRTVLSTGEATDVDAYDPSLDHWVSLEVSADDFGEGLTVFVDDDVDRERHDRILRVFRRLTRGLDVAESFTEVAELVEAAAADLTAATRSTTYRFDEMENVLRPVTDGTATPVDPDDDSLVWTAFVSGDTLVPDGPDDRVGSKAVASLDGYGVVVLDSPDHHAFDRATRRVVDLIADVAVQSLKRHHYERALNEREWELKQQSDRLDRLHQATQKLLDVEKAITHSETRDRLEGAICDELAKSERFSFVWIGSISDDDDRLIPRAWSGTERGYLQSVDFSLTPTNGEPAVRAARNRSVVHVENISHGLRGDSWRRELLKRGNQSVLSLPLVHDETLHGVLTVCAGSPSTFDDLSQSVFGEIADSIAYGIDVITDKRAMTNDSVVELDIRIGDSADLFQRLARSIDGTVSFEGVVGDPGTTTIYLSATDASATATEAFLDDSTAVNDFVRIGDGSDGGLFAVDVSEPTLVSWVRDAGGSVRRLTASPTETRLGVEVSTATNVRNFVESLQTEYPGSELLGRRTHERPLESQQTTMARLTERLTDRQLEVLKTAYLNGYFEWPRERTGEEIASLLGISQPTFNNHLRVAERKLFTMLFDA